MQTYTLTRAKRMIGLACGDDDHRPALQFVNIRADGVIEGCDGHLYVRITDSDTQRESDLARNRKIPDRGLMIHRSVIQTVQQIQGNDVADVDHTRDAIQITTDVGTIAFGRDIPCDDKYPNTETLMPHKILPTPTVKYTAMFDLGNLERLVKTIRRIFPRKQWSDHAIPIRFRFYNEPGVRHSSSDIMGTEFEVTAKTAADESVSGLLMQLRDPDAGKGGE